MSVEDRSMKARLDQGEHDSTRSASNSDTDKPREATDAAPEGSVDNVDSGAAVKNQLHTWRFFAILTMLSVTGLLTTIEGTIITNALPTITAALGGGDDYLWIANAYFLASVATLPLYAQASNIFGRRWLLLGAVAIFVLGSGLSGGSSSIGMLIASRTIQGLGGGGISLLIETVVTDIVPLRERGKYIAIVLMLSILGAAIGPFLGGVIATDTSWRWVFYINVPIGGATLVGLWLVLKVNWQRNQTWQQRVKRLDVGGNLIFIGALVSLLLALTWGGTVYEWNTYHIIVPLVLGLLGLLLFTAFEWTPSLAPEPSFPRVIVSNRTSAAALIITGLHSICTYWTFYFLPIYFQAVKGRSPLGSGVDTLPTFAGIIPFAMAGGLLLTKTGKYKLLHFVFFIPIIIGFGLFSILDQNSSDAEWVIFQLICSIGAGGLAGITLPAVQAPIEEKHVSTSTGVWSFVRNFGAILGVTIPSSIFNNECSNNAHIVSDPVIASHLQGGRAYQYATAVFLNSIENQTTRAEVIEVFATSMKTVWRVGIAFAGAGLLVVLLEKNVPLRSELVTEFGIEEEKKKEGLVAGEAALSAAADAEGLPHGQAKVE